MIIISKYNFESLNQPMINLPETMMPSEAMYLVGFNNFIENLIPGYQTLTVDGRGMLGYDLTTNDISGGDGKMFIGAKLPAREITIEYILDADKPESFIDKLDKLTNLLINKQFWFYFRDDSSWSYQGTVTSFSQPEKGYLSAKGSFVITCSDPYKYGNIEQTQTPVRINDKTKIIEIDFKPNNDVGLFKINNLNGQIMIIDGTVKGGDTIKIFPQDPSIILNGVIHTEWFGYASDIENFEMTDGISNSVPGSLTIKYRRFRL